MLLLLVFSGCTASVEKKAIAEEQQSIESTAEVETDRPWWLGDLITISGIFAGVAMIVFQLGRQHKGELKIQKENFREQLRLEIFQEYSKVLEEANEKTSDARMYVWLIPSEVYLFINQLDSGFNPAPLKSSAIECCNKYDKASISITNLSRLFEKYEIISPELEIFKMAVNVATYDMSKAIHPLHSFLLQILPRVIVDNAGNPQLDNLMAPTQEQMKELNMLVNAYIEACDDLSGYLYDLNIELQGIFLGRLFDNKVKKRVPSDPKHKVITTEANEMRKLKNYFEEETAWGKSSKKAEEDAKNALNNP